MARETYDFLPEPLRSLALDDASVRHKLLRVWGAIGVAGGGSLAGYTLYNVLRRASSIAQAHVRSSERLPLVVGAVLLALGALFLASVFGADPAAAKLRRPGAKVTGCSCISERGARYLSMTLADGSEIRWRFGAAHDPRAHSKAETAAVQAVRSLPQWFTSGHISGNS